MCLQQRVSIQKHLSQNKFSNKCFDLGNYFCFSYEYYYEEGKDQSACVDINECNIGTDRCDENALCFDQPGGYECRCKAGYNGDGFNCQSIYKSLNNHLSVQFDYFVFSQKRRLAHESVAQLIPSALRITKGIPSAVAWKDIRKRIVSVS
jgi:hypothetical protein